jgi:hypothetical protein
MTEPYNFDKIASDVKHVDSRYTWIRDDNGFVHFYKRKDYYTQTHFMTIAFHQDSGINYLEFLKTVNAICQTLSELDYAKHKVDLLNKKKGKKSARRS